MSQDFNKLSHFWKELKRRKVVPILIAYVATCYAVIEFFDITSNRFDIPDKTFDLLYLLAAIGIPVAIILPWFIYRKKEEATQNELAAETKTSAGEEKKVMHNLPAQVSNFIGRKKQMQTIKELIGKHRIVSLVGAGGCGKTRLACEVATQLVLEYNDGVWLVDLAPITAGDLVAKEITEVLKIQEEPNRDATETLIDNIKNKNLLIILDNCEHLIKACAEITGKLVQSVPGLHMLATSREALNITGEKVWKIPSLTLLDPKTIIDIESAKSSEAVLLFIDRARMNNSEFELETANVSEVVTICNKLDGIPLALELVASRTRHMNTKMIREKISESFVAFKSSDPSTPTRHRTLLSTLEWSYNLLSENEKILFTRLAVFKGGFDLEAVEEVCSDEKLIKESILDLLSSLVDRSMIYIKKGHDELFRYNRLETMRQFANQILKEKDEETELKNRHLQYFLALAEKAYQNQYEEQLEWLNKLDMDDDNLVAALEWSKDHSPEEYSRLSGSLGWYWIIKSKYVLGRHYIETALSKEINIPEVTARLLYGLGYILGYMNETEKAISLGEESLELWRSLDNLHEEANVLASLSEWHRDKIHDCETALKYGEQSLEIARQLGKPGFINRCLMSICTSLVHSKQFKKGLPYVEELIDSSEKLEQPQGIITARHFHSDCALDSKDFIEAEKRYGLGIETGMKYGNDWMAFADMQGVAFALSGQSRWAKSLRLNAASCEKARSMGVNIYGMFEFWDEWIDSYIEGARKEVGEVLTKQYEEEGIAMGFEKAVEYALDFKKD